MKILITGAFGFVGSNLSRSLKERLNAYLIALDIVAPAKHYYNDFYTWNQLQNIDWKNIDAIIHLAGMAHDTKKITDEKTYFEINLGLTQKIFNYFLKSSASKFIFFSSVKAAADSVKGELTEAYIPNPQTPYGKSKLAAENFLQCQSYPDDKKIYILRPSMIHGPGNKGNLNILYKLVQKGFPWPLGQFENKRSFTSIDNLTFVLSRILEQNISSGIYHISDDEYISTNRIIQLIAESRGHKPRIWNLNKKLMNRSAWLGDILHLPLNSERLKKLTESYVVSNKKIKKSLEIKKMDVNAEEGLKRTLSSF